MFYLINPFFSKPQFSYPKDQAQYAQIAMCLSLPASELQKVAHEILLPIHPYIYDSHQGEHTSPFGVALHALLLNQNKTHKIDPKEKLYFEVDLKTKGGLGLKSFQKLPGHMGNIFDDMLAPALNASLLVESWRHDQPIPSKCTKPQVENIKEVKLSFNNSNQTGSYDYLINHAKWAVSTKESGRKWVCIGDNNREGPSLPLGGGATCLEKDEVWQAFYGLVGSVEKCA